MKLGKLHLNVKWRLFIGFLTVTIQMMIHPYLVLYFNQRIGLRLTGIMYICVILSAVSGSLMSGFITDKMGRKKVMILAELMLAFTYSLIALFNSPWFSYPYVTVIVIIINHFFSGCFAPATMALILDSSTSEDREFIFQTNYWLNSLGVAIGSIVGGFFFLPHSFMFFCIESTLSYISVVMTAIFIKEEYKPLRINELDKKTSQFNPMRMFQKYIEVLKDKIYLFFMLGSILLFSIEHQLTNFIGVSIAEKVGPQNVLGLELDGQKLLGILKSENTLIIVLGSFIVPLIFKWINQKSKLLIGVALFTVAYFILTIQYNPLVLICAMFIGTVGQLAYNPVKQVILGRIAPDHMRGTYMAFNQMATYVGEIIAGFFLVFGTVLSHTIAAYIFLSFGLASFSLFFIMMKKIDGRTISTVKGSHPLTG